MPTVLFTQRNFVADFLQVNCNLWWKTAVLRSCAPIWRFRGNVCCSS